MNVGDFIQLHRHEDGTYKGSKSGAPSVGKYVLLNRAEDGRWLGHISQLSPALSPAWDLYVVDYGNTRVVTRKISELGESPEYGYVSEVGGFNKPSKVCGNDTHIYLANTGAGKIIKMNSIDLSYVSDITVADSYQCQGIGIDNNFLYTVEFYYDTSDSRLVKRSLSDMSVVSSIGSGHGSGNDQFYEPIGVCSDGTYLYIADSLNHRIVKRLCSDLSYVSKIGSSGSGNDQFFYPLGISTDGTYLYVADGANYRFVKRLCTDLSYVSKVLIGAYEYAQDTSCDGTYMFAVAASGHTGRLLVYDCTDLSLIYTIGAGTGANHVYYDGPCGIWCYPNNIFL